MPSLKRIHVVAVFALFGTAALLYSWLIAYDPLVGTGVAFASFVVASFAYYGDADRQTLTRVTITVTLLYGIFTLQLPVAVIAACVVYLTAWLTGTDSPLDAPETQIFPVDSTATNESDEGE